MQCQVDVPIIEISPLFGNDLSSKKKVAEQIHDVCRSHGFFFISNHGIDLGKFCEMTNRLHHEVSNKEKWDLAINAYNKENPHVRNGFYLSIPGKKAVESYCYLNPNFNKDHPMIQQKVPMHEVNRWPNAKKHPEFQPYFETHYWEMYNLTYAVLKGFALALGKKEDFFDPYFHKKDTLSSVSLIHYPYIENYPQRKLGPDGLELSFEDHLDVSLITILYQTPIQNLQVELEEGFQDLPISKDMFLVNCGTFMAHITNNYFHAPNHRVKYVNAERLSLPFFVNLGYESEIHPFYPYDFRTDKCHHMVPFGRFLEEGLQTLIIKNGQT